MTERSNPPDDLSEGAFVPTPTFVVVGGEAHIFRLISILRLYPPFVGASAKPQPAAYAIGSDSGCRDGLLAQALYFVNHLWENLVARNSSAERNTLGDHGRPGLVPPNRGPGRAHPHTMRFCCGLRCSDGFFS